MTSQKTCQAAGLLVAGLLLAGAGPPYAGQPLAEALRSLQSRGLEIFFTSHLVRPEMRVEAEPAGTDLREILDGILAPHGLASEVGPGGRLVVVTAQPLEIRGLVRVRRSSIPLPGVRILIAGTASETSSDNDGSFTLSGVFPGRHVLEAHMPGFVVERRAILVRSSEPVEVVFAMDPAPVALDEIVVTPSSISLLRDEPVSTVALDRDDIFALPHFGDDIFHALTVLPGVTGEEGSALFNVRGGRDDEVLVLLDRLELFEPYHLRDYSSATSIIPPRALREVNLITGGFSAEYGDRMSGVLDMTTIVPERRRFVLGLGTLTLEASGSGPLGGERGHWFGSLRRGLLDLNLQFIRETAKPVYWDAFGKMEYELREGQRLGVHVLHSDDDNEDVRSDEEVLENLLTGYNNSYAWLTHQAILSPRLFVDSVASIGRVERDRHGFEKELEPEEDAEGEVLFVRDERRLDVAGFKQDWNFQAAERHYWKWGFDARRLGTDYDYLNLRKVDDPLEELRDEPRKRLSSFQERLTGEQYSVYVSDRLRPLDRLTLELGARYDEQTLTDDRKLSPRFNLVYAPSHSTALRLAWGHYFQSQRPYELQVEDGETEFAQAELTEQRVIGFEHSFATGANRADLLLRVEAYQRLISDPRTRYENLYEPVTEFPETEIDRFQIAPEHSSAYGVEVFLRGGLGRRVEWWTSYTYSRVEDRIDGQDVPRRIDQPHALNVDWNFKLGKRWNLNLAWRYHTGWPTTAVMGGLEEDDEGELQVVPVFGSLNGERLPDYHRLDLRASREWRKKRGVLGFYLEIQNVYDRGNVAGFDSEFEFEVQPTGDVDLVEIEEIWGGILGSFGITWQF